MLIRRAVAPQPPELVAPAPPAGRRRRRGRVAGALTTLGVLTTAALASQAMRDGYARQVEATALSVVLVALASTKLGRAVRRRLPRGRAWRIWLAACYGTALAAWVSGLYILVACPVVAGILWGAARGRKRRVSQSIEAVKPAEPEQHPLEDKWPMAATRAGVVVPTGPDKGSPLPLAGPPEMNGVGGTVLRVALPPGLAPDQVGRNARRLARWLQVPYAYVRAAGEDVVDAAEIHVYGRFPLTAQPVTWRQLAPHTGGGVARVPFALDVYGDAIYHDPREWVLITGVTNGGKTGTQLAIIAGIAQAQIPVDLRLCDNRSDGDSELRMLADVAVGYARTHAETWWQIRQCQMEISRRRAAGVSADNRPFAPTDEWPLVHLAVTEQLSLAQSDPPGEPPLRLSWEEFTAGRHSTRPDIKDWRAMVAEGMGQIAREGRSAGVGGSGCAQAAQIGTDAFPAPLRRVIPRYIAHRLPKGSDVDPALTDGALAAGATANDLPEHPGLLYVMRAGVPVLGRAAWVPPAEITEVAALLREAEIARAHQSAAEAARGN